MSLTSGSRRHRGHLVRQRRVGSLVALIGMMGGVLPTVASAAPQRPLLNPIERSVEGRPTLTGCNYPLRLVLPVGQRAIEQRVVSENSATCTVRVQEGVPAAVELPPAGATIVTTTDRPPGETQSLQSRRARKQPGHISHATTKSSGWYRTWYQDPPGIDVTWARSTVTWNWNNISTSTVTCGHAWGWYSPSGWSRTDQGQACSNPSTGAQSETYGRFRNGLFCATIDTINYHWPTYVFGRKNGSLVGQQNSSKFGGCTGLLSFRHQLVRTLN